jgi:preprotein translocase subunit SecA
MVDKAIDTIVEKYYPDLEIKGLRDEVLSSFLVKLDVTPEEFQKLEEEGLKGKIKELTREFYDRKEKRYGAELMSQVERFAMLTIIDEKWKDHLREMDDLKEGINFRAYGQKDPLVEYKLDGFKLFDEMLNEVRTGVISFIFKFTTQTPEEAANIRAREVNRERLQTSHDTSDGMGFQGNLEPVESEAAHAGKKQPVKVGKKVGRNDPCPCGSGKKYKNCHGKNG